MRFGAYEADTKAWPPYVDGCAFNKTADRCWNGVVDVGRQEMNRL